MIRSAERSCAELVTIEVGQILPSSLSKRKFPPPLSEAELLLRKTDRISEEVTALKSENDALKLQLKGLEEKATPLARFRSRCVSSNAFGSGCRGQSARPGDAEGAGGRQVGSGMSSRPLARFSPTDHTLRSAAPSARRWPATWKISSR